jgi:protein ImuA
MSRPASSSLLALRDRIRQIEEPARHGVLPFGVAALDCALPGGGLARGAVHEILGAGGDEEDGAAATGFAAGILARLGPLTNPPPQAGEGRVGAAGSGPVLWCLRRPDLYGPGLLAHGLDPARLVLVGARRDDEILWAVEEGLRNGLAAGLAAVVGEIGHLPMVASRRLQLAAERSGVTALILRRWRNAAEAAAERDRPSAALTRWRVAALPSADITGEPGIDRPRWRVELRRARGGVPGIWDMEVADATGHVSLSAELADRPVAPARLRAVPGRPPASAGDPGAGHRRTG